MRIPLIAIIIALLIALAIAYFGQKIFFDQQNKHLTHLYKILSVEHWEQSKDQKNIVLSEMDREFIHLATEQQLDRIAKKFWGDVPIFIVLTLETSKLPGRLVLEKNPGGETKYYHLYDGSIPHEAIIATRTVKKSE